MAIRGLKSDGMAADSSGQLVRSSIAMFMADLKSSKVVVMVWFLIGQSTLKGLRFMQRISLINCRYLTLGAISNQKYKGKTYIVARRMMCQAPSSGSGNRLNTSRTPTLHWLLSDVK